MVSRPLAFGLVVAACVVAAGTGAYIATLQHARSDSAMAAGQGAAPLAAPARAAAQAAPMQSQAPVSPATAFPEQPAPGDAPAVNATSVVGTASGMSADARPVAVGRASARPARTASTPRPASAAEVRAAAEPETKVVSGAAAVNQAPAPVQAPPDEPVAEQPPAEPEPAWLEVTVPSESVIGLQLESSISSEQARVEDRVDARVTRDVRVDGRVAIPAGARAIGSVLVVERGGKIKERARLGIRFHTLVLPDSTRIAMTTDTVYREGEPPSKKSSAKIGGAAIGGAIIGAILGGGKGAAIGTGIGAAGGTAAAMAGDRQTLVLAAGTPINVRIQAPITLTVEK